MSPYSAFVIFRRIQSSFKTKLPIVHIRLHCLVSALVLQTNVVCVVQLVPYCFFIFVLFAGDSAIENSPKPGADRLSSAPQAQGGCDAPHGETVGDRLHKCRAMMLLAIVQCQQITKT